MNGPLKNLFSKVFKKREMTSLPDGTKIAKKRKGRQDLRSFNRSERKARVEAGYGTDVGNFFRRFKILTRFVQTANDTFWVFWPTN